MGVLCEMLFCFTALTGCIVAQSTEQWLSAGSVFLLANICVNMKRQSGSSGPEKAGKKATNQNETAGYKKGNT